MTLTLVCFMILLTSVLIYTLSDAGDKEVNGIHNLPDAMYISVLMLTGQGSPEEPMSIGLKALVIVTSFLSVTLVGCTCCACRGQMSLPALTEGASSSTLGHLHRLLVGCLSVLH